MEIYNEYLFCNNVMVIVFFKLFILMFICWGLMVVLLFRKVNRDSCFRRYGECLGIIIMWSFFFLLYSWLLLIFKIILFVIKIIIDMI